METKICFKCGIDKPLAEYYKHSQMGDNYFGKCKECTIKDVKNNYEKKSKDPKWVEKERARGREKYKRLNYLDRYADDKERFKFRKAAIFKNIHRDMKVAGLIEEGMEGHHWDYNNPYSIIILSRSLHKRIHQRMVLDILSLYYKGDNGEMLNTMEDHVAFISTIANEFTAYEDIRPLLSNS